MKNKKSLTALLLVLVLCVISGCGLNDPDGLRGKTVINVILFKGGYGTEWLDNIMAEYKTTNSGIAFKTDRIIDNAAFVSEIKSGLHPADIILTTTPPSDLYASGYLEDLKEIYEHTGEDGKTLAERMKKNVHDFYKIEDSYTGLPWSNSVSGILYNEDVLSELFPDGFALPRTSRELLSLSDAIKDKGAFAFTSSAGTAGTITGGDYTLYLVGAWWAQLCGAEAFQRFSEGYYYNESDAKFDFGANGEAIIDVAEKETALKEFYTFARKQNGYMHQYADAMDFQEAQAVFLGFPYGAVRKKAAFMVNGDWFENEMRETLESDLPATIKMMKTPVISAITEKCQTVNDEDMLCKVIDFVDGVRPDAPSGVSAADIERIREARNTAYFIGTNHSLLVPKSTKVKSEVMDFLKFLTDKTASSIYTDSLNGLRLPYGFDLDSDKKTAFVSSVLDSYSVNMVPVQLDYSKQLVFKGGLNHFHDEYILSKIFSEMSVDDYIYLENKYFRDNWKNILVNAGLQA